MARLSFQPVERPCTSQKTCVGYQTYIEPVVLTRQDMQACLELGATTTCDSSVGRRSLTAEDNFGRHDSFEKL